MRRFKMRNVIPFLTTGLTTRGLNHRLWSDFDDVFANLNKDYFLGEEDNKSIIPSSELQETEKAFLVSVDLPGIRKEDLQVEVLDGKLTITGERKSRAANASFRKVYALNSQVDVDRIEAHYENGVLDLSLPKVSAKMPKKIEIQSGKIETLNKN